MTEETTPAVHSAPFLSRITLRNFKSVVGQEVSLAPLTLIVGENSSGKSSLLQAVRLMQQAARSKTPGDSFPLNGDSISVGNIEDVRSAQTEEEESVSIGFDIYIPNSFDDDHSDHPNYNMGYDCSFCDDLVDLIDWMEESTMGRFIIRWQVDLGAEQSKSTALRKINFSITDINGDARIYVSINRQKEYNKAITLSGALPNDHVIQQITENYLAFKLIEEIIAHPKDERSPDHKGGKNLIECVLDHIAESGFEFPEAIFEIPELIDLGCTLIILEEDSHYNYNLSLVPVIADLLNIKKSTWPVLEVRRPDPDAHMSGALLGVMSVSTPQTPVRIEDLDPQEVLRILSSKALKSNLSSQRHSPEVLIAGTRYLDKLCNNNIKYLGPLRESPEKLTPRASLGQAGDIGPSGEFTASVLQRFGNDTVLAPTPDGESSEMPLIEAVQEWGRYLRLLRSIRVVQEAKLGNVIIVESEGLNKEVPLDAVGVGVSQLLPVLVLCLLSKPGSMILLEQPELHLHPALQQRLADFLIAAARSGRQLIVETHSEYIVSRLRRRIAEDTSDEDELLSMSKIVFAERDPQTGVTTYREVELSPFGRIEDWPRGFFDQASEEEREIIRSGFRKIAEREDRLTDPE